jgi:hypothetical protein
MSGDKVLRRQIAFSANSVREIKGLNRGQTRRVCVMCLEEVAHEGDHGLAGQFHRFAEEFFGEWSMISGDANLVPLCSACHHTKNRIEAELSCSTDKQAIFSHAHKYLSRVFRADGSRREITVLDIKDIKNLRKIEGLTLAHKVRLREGKDVSLAVVCLRAKARRRKKNRRRKKKVA